MVVSNRRHAQYIWKGIFDDASVDQTLSISFIFVLSDTELFLGVCAVACSILNPNSVDISSSFVVWMVVPASFCL